MTEVEWGDPPVSKRTDAVGFVASLRNRPGVWAKYPRPFTSANSASAYAKNHPGTQWTARKIDGQVWMWARYVGGGE